MCLNVLLNVFAIFVLQYSIYYSAVVEQGAKEYGDEVRLVRSSEPDDDVERDSIRHRVSEQTLPNDSDSSD